MVRFDVLSITVMGFVLFVCQPALSLETGCSYPDTDSVEKDVLHYDLKCTYLFSGLTQMTVSKHLFGLVRVSMVIGKIFPYIHTTKNQILSLYRLKEMRMGALWALHLYLAMLGDFYNKSSNKEEDSQKIIATHNYIIAQLRKDLTDCSKDNSFNNEWKVISNTEPSKEYLMTLLSNNVTEANELLAKNNRLSADQPSNDSAKNALQIGKLLLNNIGSKDDFLKDLMDAFNVQVHWSNAGERLKTYWHGTRILYWPIIFINLKLYYELVFNFLKIIMFRLTSKHLCYLETYSSGTDSYEHYVKEWCNKVRQFGHMLGLSEDLHVKDLLVHLGNLVKQEETIDSVMSYLNPILKTLCLPLGCEATKEFELNGNELKPFKSTINIEELKIEKSPVDIEYYSLENTRVFLSYLSWIFSYSDFNLIQSFVEYINELKPY